MSSSSLGRSSELGKERWRSSRRKPSTVTSEDHPPGHAGSSYVGRNRNGQPTSPPLGKLLSILSSPSFLRILFCIRGARFGTGSSRSHRRLAATGNGLSAGSLKDPNEKSISRASRKNPSTPGTAPPANPTLIVHPGSGSGRTSPPGEGNPRSFAGGLQY